MPLPEYVLRRLRTDPVHTAPVVAGSTPVIAFGDLFASRAATLGLNPSNLEFLGDRGGLLQGDNRRLATIASLKVNRLSELSTDQAQVVADECASYFDRNPYRRWFDQLEPILNAVGSSYYDRTACHLDLVQWATDPKWSRLPTLARRTMLQDDAPFLAEQLKRECIEILLLNGATVARHFRNRFPIEFCEQEPLVDFGHTRTRVFRGVLFDRVLVIGWSTNVQSSFGVRTERRQALARTVGEIAREFLMQKNAK